MAPGKAPPRVKELLSNQTRNNCLSNCCSIVADLLQKSEMVADNSEFRNIEYVEISENKDIQLKMLFDPKTNLEERIINEQFIY